MIATRSLRFALCALLLLAPLATLAAQEMQDDMMKDDGSFYISGAYSAALPGERDLSDESTKSRAGVGTEIGFLGGQIGVGYAIAGFRPEISVGYRTASVDSITLKEAPAISDAVLKGLNDQFAKAGEQISGSVTSIDLAASVYYDIDTGTEITPYVGVGGGMSQVTVKVEQTVAPLVPDHDDSLWALSFQAAAGIGYAVMEDLTVTLGYRLIGTLEGNFSEYDKSMRKTGMTLNHNVELGLRYSFSF
jgi:opacity protein-like surface antigen